jgi:acetolactate synthase-1/2/3 large subunit
MRKKNCWEMIVSALEAEEVEYVFGMPGSSKLLYDAMYESKKVRPVHAREQSSGVFMAIGYSRVSGKHGVCYGGPGPGMTNMISGMMEAYATCTPLIILSATASTQTRGLPAFQEADQLEMARAVTKWAVRVDSPSRIPWAIRRAFAVSMNGKPGPVYLEIPSDISVAKVAMPDYVRAEYPIRCAGDPERVEQAVELILNSKRPVLFCGGGTILSRAFDQVRAIVDQYRIPIATSASGRGIISENHPLAIGLTGVYSTEFTRQIISEADLLISVGTRNEQFETANWSCLPPGCRLIHIDIDPFEISRNWLPDVAVVGDAALVLAEINSRLAEVENSSDTWRTRADVIVEAKEAFCVKVDEECRTDSIPIRSKRVVREVNRVFGDNTILVNENGSQDLWSYHFPYYRVADEGCCVPPGAQTCMGFGVAAAIGAKLAKQDRNVVCITGDGAFQMYMRELGTARQHDAPITYVILNNSCLGWIKVLQQRMGERYVCSSFDPSPDFAKIASAYECYGENVYKPSDIKPALRRALDANRHGIPAAVSFTVDWTEVPSGFNYYYGSD